MFFFYFMSFIHNFFLNDLFLIWFFLYDFLLLNIIYVF